MIFLEECCTFWNASFKQVTSDIFAEFSYTALIGWLAYFRV
jgi:hypothetical protein